MKGLAIEDLTFVKTLDMRYIGQAFELNVNFPANLTSEALEKGFYDAYEMLYGQADRDKKTEIVNIRVSGIHHNPRPALSVKRQAVTLPSREISWTSRPVYFEETGFIDCKVCERHQIPYSTDFDGPAIVEEFGSTTVVPPGSTVTVDHLGNLIIDVYGRNS